jgi:deoxyribonuclease V
VFISPGHLIDIPSSIKIVLKFTTTYKIPEPVRLSHIYSNSFRRGEL